MGTRGPMRKRGEDLKGHVSLDRRYGDDVTKVSAANSLTFKSPQPSKNTDWSDSAKLIWTSLSKSIQASLYEETDWAIAYQLMGRITDYQAQAKRNSELLTGIAQGFDSLLMTEGSRRRLRLEVDPPDPPVTSPRAKQKWHKDAKRLYQAARGATAINRFYQPSDWAVLHFIMWEQTHALNKGVRSGKLENTFDSILSNLMLTEGTRRRLDLELGAAETEKTGKTAGDMEVERWLQSLIPNDASSLTEETET